MDIKDNKATPQAMETEGSDFLNVYEDANRAMAYAALEFPGTYYLAYRDLPDIIQKHTKGNKALDFGCGAGRSTRFLKRLDFETIGVDIAENMLYQARLRDSQGDYRLVSDGSLDPLGESQFDLILSVFTFDNIPTFGKKIKLFQEFNRVLKKRGTIVNLVSSPEIYTNEWASFTTREITANKSARCGDKVYTVMKDVADKRPVEDILWTDEAYRAVYQQSGFEVSAVYRPLGKRSEPFEWINETEIAPWVIYVLEKRIDP